VLGGQEANVRTRGIAGIWHGTHCSLHLLQTLDRPVDSHSRNFIFKRRDVQLYARFQFSVPEQFEQLIRRVATLRAAARGTARAWDPWDTRAGARAAARAPRST
jgi:hypothetical protein